jgi:hypothetical protein
VTLKELNAEFVTAAPDGGLGSAQGIEDADGVWFDCPRCKDKDGHGVLVWCRGTDETRTPLARWIFAGTSLDDLSLSPSINIPDACGAHFWVRSGSIEMC